MSLSGNVGGMNVVVRESPSLTSPGRTSIRQGPGSFEIESFFDVYTELSVGGGPFIPQSNPDPGRMTLCPEPATLALLAFGGLAVLRRKRQ